MNKEHRCEAMEDEFEGGGIRGESFRISQKRANSPLWFLQDLDCTCRMKKRGIPIRFCPFCGQELGKGEDDGKDSIAVDR